MLVDLGDLAGPGDLAQEHRVTLQLISYWRKLAGFPEPLITLSCGPVFSKFAVSEWVTQYYRERELRKTAA